MTQLFAIAAGGALGALLRYWVALAVHAWLGRDFPYGTLAVNLLGSFAMGLLYVLLIERVSQGEIWRAFLLIGVLGAFTTFSTFSMETVNLLQVGEYSKALLNVLLSVMLCVAAAALGLLLGRQL